MNQEMKNYYINFLKLMASLFLMYILAVTLSEPVSNIVLLINDKEVTKSLSDHAIFWIGALIFSAFWARLWLTFKKAEKACIDHLSKQ